jgi:hypothetical protein
MHYIAERPWIWIIVAFIVLTVCLAQMVTIAVKNQPDTVTMPYTSPKKNASH